MLEQMHARIGDEIGLDRCHAVSAPSPQRAVTHVYRSPAKNVPCCIRPDIAILKTGDVSQIPPGILRVHQYLDDTDIPDESPDFSLGSDPPNLKVSAT